MALLFSSENGFGHVGRHKSAILFFVRVNQVLVRLWARVTSCWCRSSSLAVFLAIDD